MKSHGENFSLLAVLTAELGLILGDRVTALLRWRSRLSWILILLLILPLAVQAQFNYVTNNGTITITGYTGSGGAETIPSTIDGLPVTSVGGYAFSGIGGLTSITIPGSVTNIGTYAFQSCSSLAGVTIGEGIKVIGFGAFFECTSLTNVVIPNTLISLDTYAFRGYSSLASVTIPNTVTSIGNGAFFECSSLISVVIGSNVSNIGSSVFYECGKLEAIVVDGSNSFYSSLDGVLFNKTQTTLIQCPGSKSGLYNIPGSVTVIGSGAFNYCTKLTSVIIPNSVLSVRDASFFSCFSLTSVTIPDSVTNIGSAAWTYCVGLTNVTIGKNVTTIGSRAFAECTSLIAISVDPLNSAYLSDDGVLFNKNQTTLAQCPAGKAGSYTVPTNVKSIGNDAFSSCVRLTSVTIPNGLTSIGDYAFSSCTNLASITIPPSVTTLGDRAFVACSSLTAVYFSGNAPWLGSFYVFYNANHVTVFYLLGTMGWGSLFGGRPTALWLPRVQTSDACFGVQTNQFGFIIAWASGMAVVVEASTSIDQPTWVPLQTNTLTSGSFYFSDHNGTNYLSRFYRLRSP